MTRISAYLALTYLRLEKSIWLANCSRNEGRGWKAHRCFLDSMIIIIDRPMLQDRKWQYLGVDFSRFIRDRHLTASLSMVIYIPVPMFYFFLPALWSRHIYGSSPPYFFVLHEHRWTLLNQVLGADLSEPNRSQEYRSPELIFHANVQGLFSSIVHVTRLCDHLGNSILSQMAGIYCQTETKGRKLPGGDWTAFSLLFLSGNKCQPFERELSSPGGRKVSWHGQYPLQTWVGRLYISPKFQFAGLSSFLACVICCRRSRRWI